MTILTQVLVDKDDPSILDPTKFIGPFFQKEEVAKLEETRKWTMKEDRGGKYRRVVSSPIPVSIYEKDIIRTLVEQGIVVVAGGGGGIPVYFDERGWLEGIDGVIDKDRTSAVLAHEIGADSLVIVTGVDKVAINFGKADQQELSRLTVSEAKQYLDDGQFPAGSMGPKIGAAIDFIENGGKQVIITSIEKAAEALKGNEGTVIVKE